MHFPFAVLLAITFGDPWAEELAEAAVAVLTVEALGRAGSTCKIQSLKRALLNITLLSYKSAEC
jgi:hypothetical protein